MNLWEVLAEPMTLGDVVRDLAARFETDEPTIRTDVLPVLRTLRDLGLVEAAT